MRGWPCRSESRISSRCLLTHASRSGHVLRRRGRRPRRDDGAHQVARRVAELRLFGRPRPLFLDEAREELALEPRARDRARPAARRLGQRRGERRDAVRGLRRARCARARKAKRSSEPRGSRPWRPRRGPPPCRCCLSTRPVGGAGALARARQPRIGRRDPAHRVVFEVRRSVATCFAVVDRRGAADVGRRPAPRRAHPPTSTRPTTHAPQRLRARVHSPITLTMRRLSRCPSNSA